MYGKQWLSHTQIYEWYKWLKEGQIEDVPQSGLPLTSTTNENIKKKSVIWLGRTVYTNFALKFNAKNGAKDSLFWI